MFFPDSRQSSSGWLVAVTTNLALATFIAIMATRQGVWAGEPELISFNRHVRPILSDKCFACHGFDAKKRQAELRLDTPEGAREAHSGKAAIVANDLAASELWRRINSSDEAEAMPPAESHKSLSTEEKAILRLWIEQGANYQKHWAFEAITTPQVPSENSPEAHQAGDRKSVV